MFQKIANMTLAKNSAILYFMFNIEHVVETFGFFSYLILFVIIFAETGLLIGFFLPGDSLLFAAGFIASQGYLNIVVLCIILFIAAVVGDSVGYAIGHKFGKRLFKREDSFWFHKDHLIRAKNFYDIHGGKTIIIGRFLPIIRTFAPVVAGMSGMEYSKFITYNLIGGVLWAIGMPLAGFFLGQVIPEDKIDVFIIPIVLLIVFISIAPAFFHVAKNKESRQKVVASIKHIHKRIRTRKS